MKNTKIWTYKKIGDGQINNEHISMGVHTSFQGYGENYDQVSYRAQYRDYSQEDNLQILQT